MSAINKETKRFAAKTIKDDFNSVLRNASNYTNSTIKGKSTKLIKTEAADTKELLVSFYDKLISDSGKVGVKEQAQMKSNNTFNEQSSTSRMKIKATQRKSAKPTNELDIPCTNDLCSKVRQLVEMNAQVQRFKKKFLEPPGVENDRKVLHQRKIEVGNEFSRKNLSSFKKINAKSVKGNKQGETKCSTQTSKRVGWNPQTLITPEVLSSSSTESLVAKSVEVSLYQSYDTFNDCSELAANSTHSSHSLRGIGAPNIRRNSEETACESEYATCAEDSFDVCGTKNDEIPVRKTSSAEMLMHFRQLLNQHTLQKDTEKVKCSVLTDEEVRFLKNIVEADERYRYLKQADHRLLKSVLKAQLKQIESQERILEEALRKLRGKTESDETVSSEKQNIKTGAFESQIKVAEQPLQEMAFKDIFVVSEELQQSMESSEKLETFTLEEIVINTTPCIVSKFRSSGEQDVFSTPVTQRSKSLSHSMSVCFGSSERADLMQENDIILTSPASYTQPSTSLSQNLPKQMPFSYKQPSTPHPSPVSAGRSFVEFPAYSDQTLEDASSNHILTAKQFDALSPLDNSKEFQGSLVPPLDLHGITLEPMLESPIEGHKFYSERCPKLNEKADNPICRQLPSPAIEVIFRNISSPQKEIQLLKAVSARLEKTMEKTGTAFTCVNSVELNLKDDSEKTASAIAMSELPCTKFKINENPKVTKDGIMSVRGRACQSQTDDFFLEPPEIEPLTLQTVEFFEIENEYFRSVEEYPQSTVRTLHVLHEECFANEFKVKYLSIDEIPNAGDFYIFRSTSVSFEPEKTNFEKLKSNPEELGRILTPKIREIENEAGFSSKNSESKYLEQWQSNSSVFKIPDEVIINNVICCLFKTWASYPDLYNRAMSPIGHSPKIDDTRNRHEFAAGDCNVNDEKLYEREKSENQACLEGREISCSKNVIQNESSESLPYVECESPHVHEENFNSNCFCYKIPQKECDMIEKKKKMKNSIVFTAQFILFLLLVLSLSMPNYQCLKF